MRFLNYLSSAMLLVFLASAAFAGGEAADARSGSPRASRWRSERIVLKVSSSLKESPNIKAGSDIDGAIARSLAAWQPYIDIELIVRSSKLRDVSQKNSPDGVNLLTVAASPQNILFFANDIDSAAKTRTFTNRSGSIVEGDIVLSPFHQFSTDGTYGTFDLEATLRHEIGHLLGLRHSFSLGSVMSATLARNGISRISADVSADDISAVHALYGNDDTYGGIDGKVQVPARFSKEIELWVQDAESGAVVATAKAGREGNYTFSGLDAGKYSVFARAVDSASSGNVQFVGEAELNAGTSVALNFRLSDPGTDGSLIGIGENGMIADQPVAVDRESTRYLIVATSKPILQRVEIDSPSMMIDPESITLSEYAEGVWAIGLRVRTDGSAAKGSYNICLVDAFGGRDCLIGAVRIDGRK